ncbi:MULTISPECIES: G1 family glutamic endopeptidase [unclassified Caballeronia]|uniref:G1 family glutamic endopeptidase n=1 Tax=unclassified Caballeronia TaxID=2646786 RepID=UPI002857E32F|nr:MULTISPECIES: G1 family glutamic endopeptidase [unclassified Caballeronia]MDR5818359.1 G1 family endopeptidase [Caballeronia sp. LZ033]MDR5883202.1 G1 family endopeptidase [Caballeronia sp. LZ032]
MDKSVINKLFMFAAFSWLLIDATASHAQASTADVTMQNWAGYVINDAAYSSVYASWVVPSVDCSAIAAGGASASYAWVGLGGYNDAVLKQNSLEQIGTAQSCNGTTPSYAVFYEFVPAGPQFGGAQYPLSAGDTVTAMVVQNLDGSYTLLESATAKGATSPKWMFNTKGSAPGASALDPGNKSAEVVMEQPGIVGWIGRAPVANYGSITFFNVGFTKANTASDEISKVQYFEPLSGNTLSNFFAFPATLSPTSFIVYQI